MASTPKRPRAWCEYGYASDLSFENYFLAYDRDGLGNAAVDIIADKCWQDHPWLIEGAPDRESTELTANEARIDRVFSQVKVWQAFKEADVMALVAGWSAIIIRIADSNELDQPTVRPSIEALTELGASMGKPTDRSVRQQPSVTALRLRRTTNGH